MIAGLNVHRWTALAAAAALLAASAPPQAATGPVTLSVTGRTSANVSLAASGALVVAAWSASAPGGETDIFAAVSRDAGVSFAAPVRVNSVPGDARTNGEQPPRITLAKKASGPPTVTIVWTSKNDRGSTIMQGRSDDGGRTFGRSSLVPDGAAAGNRGWQNAVADAQGRTRVVWLDHRDMAAPASADEHAHHGHDSATPARDGVSMAQKSKLYLATAGANGTAAPIAAGVCYCCKTAIVAGPADTLYLAWRHVYPGNLRDIAFTFSRDGGKTFASPRRVSEDRWQLDGCPDDGPAMAIDAATRLHIAWPTLVADGGTQPTIGIFYAQSRDGQAFGPRERLVTQGLAHHPQVTVSGETVTVAWDELQNGRRRIVLATRAAGVATGPFQRRVIAEGAGLVYPTIAAVPDGGVIAAWTAGGERSSVQVTRVQ